MKRWWLYHVLTVQDILRLWASVQHHVIIVSGICLPILLLLGLKNGHVANLREELLRSPTGRQVVFWSGQHAELMTSELASSYERKIPGVDIVIPEIQRLVSLSSNSEQAKARKIDNVTLYSTRPGDPILSQYGGDVIGEDDDEIVLMRSVAETLHVRRGETVQVTVERERDGVTERASVSMKVKALIDQTNDESSNVGYATVNTLSAMEQYVMGYQVRRFGWPAFKVAAPDSYASYLIVCEKTSPLTEADHATFKERNYDVGLLKDEKLRTLHGLLKSESLDKLLVYRLTAEGAEGWQQLRIAPGELARLTEADDIVLPWNQPIIKDVQGEKHRLLGLSLPKRTWLRLYMKNREFGYDFNSDTFSAQLVDGQSVTQVIDVRSSKGATLRLATLNLSAMATPKTTTDPIATQPPLTATPVAPKKEPSISSDHVDAFKRLSEVLAKPDKGETDLTPVIPVPATTSSDRHDEDQANDDGPQKKKTTETPSKGDDFVEEVEPSPNQKKETSSEKSPPQEKEPFSAANDAEAHAEDASNEKSSRSKEEAATSSESDTKPHSQNAKKGESPPKEDAVESADGDGARHLTNESGDEKTSLEPNVHGQQQNTTSSGNGSPSAAPDSNNTGVSLNPSPADDEERAKQNKAVNKDNDEPNSEHLRDTAIIDDTLVRPGKDVNTASSESQLRHVSPTNSTGSKESTPESSTTIADANERTKLSPTSQDIPLIIVPMDLLAHLHAESTGRVEYDSINRLFVAVPRQTLFDKARLYADSIDRVPTVVEELRERGFAIMSEVTRIREIHQQDNSLQLLVLIVGLGVFLFGTLTVVSVLLDSTERKRGTIGILRVMGVSRFGVFYMVILRSVIIGILAAGVTIGVGFLAAMFFNWQPSGDVVWAQWKPVIQIVISPQDAVIVVFGALTCCGLGSLIPARKASGMDPFDAIVEGRFR